MHAISVRGLNKTFAGRRALHDINLELRGGEMVALIGPSGSGKSTLLRHLAGFVEGDRDGSEVQLLGELIQRDGRLARHIRRARSHVGFVFQQFNLVGRLSLLTNVLAGHLYRIPTSRALLRWFTADERAAGMAALAQVGIDDYAFQRASTLSGGQQQRAAIARALVQDARIVLADEPIASLDPESSRKVMEILSRINREQGRTVLVSLHQVDTAIRYCDRVIAMRQGRIVFDGLPTQLDEGFLAELYGGDPETAFASPAALPERREPAAIQAAA
ncbi:MAG: phosphonate ABC transporter ATP-binding protein [Rhodocyclaceae bacterium]|nr:phosphonate ABC transporter ATP-binding protein [Rhodocyclaceae bacterium]